MPPPLKLADHPVFLCRNANRLSIPLTSQSIAIHIYFPAVLFTTIPSITDRISSPKFPRHEFVRQRHPQYFPNSPREFTAPPSTTPNPKIHNYIAFPRQSLVHDVHNLAPCLPFSSKR